MELDSFVSIILQDLIFILSDVIEYQCLFYMVIYEALKLREHRKKVG